MKIQGFVNRSRISFALSFVIALTFSTSAHAFFFFFIPSGVFDKLQGVEGDNCVSPTTKVGDVITSAVGNTATIKSLSGTSDRCRESARPIRALVEFNMTFSSNAGVEIPDGYEKQALTPIQMFQGNLLQVKKLPENFTININARKVSATPDVGAYVHNVSEVLIQRLDNAKVDWSQKIEVNGMPAWQFQLTGTNKGIFGRNYTYLVTAIQGDTQILVLNESAPTSDFDTVKPSFLKIIESARGLKDPSVMQVAQPLDEVPPTPAATAQTMVSAPALTQPATATEDDLARRLRSLTKLHQDGLISDDDFEQKKQEILKAL